MIHSNLKAVLVAGLLMTTMFGCGSQEGRLRSIESSQDSILTLLRSMQEKHEFMAKRMGWRPPPDTNPQNIPIGSSFSRGPEKAVVTLVEFSDLQCPYCALLAPILDSVAKVYPNDVRLVFKHFPLSIHPQARAAAAAGMAAGNQGKFFEFRSKVLTQFRSLGDSLYLATAKDLGLDLERFRKEMPLTPEINRQLDEDMALGTRIGVEGTPTVYANGRMTTDRSFDYFAGLVEKARAKR